jgi:hypothetical protein
MILGSLVDGPEGFIELDKNLGKSVGDEHVDAFHEEAADVVLNEVLTNPVINDAMMRNPVIMKELHAAVTKYFAARKAKAAVGAALPAFAWLPRTAAK